MFLLQNCSTGFTVNTEGCVANVEQVRANSKQQSSAPLGPNSRQDRISNFSQKLIRRTKVCTQHNTHA
jgi:hypothetical protein